MSYPIEIIDTDEKHRLYTEFMKRPLFSRKANIYGCCIKFIADDRSQEDLWSDNFFTADENNRSHGRILAMHDPSQPLHVKYDPLTKTAFIYNFDYYGWIKSVALAIAGDILEDAHEIYSVHGAALDNSGSGVALIAKSGVGKTTHSWGMLRNPGVRLVSDDWFFVRIYEHSALAFGSEKNNYVDTDLGKIWGAYGNVLEKAVVDKNGRAIVNARWVVGADGVVPITTMKKIFLLKRDPTDQSVVREISADEAKQILIENDFFNPHQLVRDRRKNELRTAFFKDLISKTRAFMANTSQSPQIVQDAIFKAATSS